MHYIKARNEIRRLTDGEVIEFLFIDKGAAKQASMSLEKDGHEILSVGPDGTAMKVGVRKKIS